MDQGLYPEGQRRHRRSSSTKAAVIILLVISVMLLSLTCMFAVMLFKAEEASSFNGDTSEIGKYVGITSEPEGSRDELLQQGFAISTVSDGAKLTIKEVAKLTSPSVVEITTELVVTSSYFTQYVTEGAGSGVIISADGFIVTNNHVINGARSITVRLVDGRTYSADVVGSDQSEDIAVIKIPENSLPPCVFGNSDAMEVGDEVIAIGNPIGTLGGTVTNGIISATGRKIEIDGNKMTLLQTNAALSPGNSGGGLFNTAGELIGIVNAKSAGDHVEGLGFAIPTNHAKKIIEDLINYGYTRGKVSLGAEFIDIYSNYYLHYYGLGEYGVYVYSTEANGDLREAGIKSGDMVISINGTKIATKDQINELMYEAGVGDTLKFIIKRNGQESEINVKLTEFIPS